MVSADTRSVIDRAKQIYAERLQAALEADHRGRFVAIEPDSGDYFLADTSTGRSGRPARAPGPPVPHRSGSGTPPPSTWGSPDGDRARR